MSSILSENVGYLVLIGVGAVMALAVTLMVKAETKWLGTRKTSEWFYTAGRTIKTGLIASSIVSAWTWAATLLQSSTVTFEFGIGGSFWYAAGASIQVILFSILAVELKRKAPMTHTFPEMLYVRFGKHAHKVFLCFGLMTNTIVTAMLVLGGAAVVNSLTGVDITIAAFLIPLGIIFYTVFGGLKATFFAEYLNTSFIFVVVLIFVVVIYFVTPDIGGIPGMYDKLVQASTLSPVEGNLQGTYLTLVSVGALIFGIINIVGNFGTVFVDQSYWQRAIAARPRAATRGFIIGGLVWFAIPFTLATTLGLAAIATGVTLSDDQIDLGLVAPTAAEHIMGDLGAILILTIVFTAVVAAGSSQLISVSSLMTYDVFRTYFKPSASGRELIRISRITILVFGVGMGALASILFQLGVSLQYVYLMMGILVGSAVAPISFALLWKKTNRHAATGAALVGLASGVLSWFLTANLMFGEITLSSTGNILPLLIGNITSILVSVGITLVGSLIIPENFNFDIIRQKIVVVDDKIRSMMQHDTDEEFLKRSLSFCKRVGFSITVFLVVVWPSSFFLSEFVFDEQSFHLWVSLAIVWAFGAAGVIILLPMIEARHSIYGIFHRATMDADVVGQYGQASDSPDYAIVKILIPVDGSANSLKALYHANYFFRGMVRVRVYMVHVIEWADEDDRGVDMDLTKQVMDEGRMVLRSVAVPKQIGDYQRIVKLGNPSEKIVKLADSLKVDMIIIGKKGLGRSSSKIGHVAQSVLDSSSRPVVLLD